MIAELARLLGPNDAEPRMLELGFNLWAALRDADRNAVPPDALAALGAWAGVHPSDPRWTDLMIRTLELTDGNIDEPSDLARTLRDLQPSDQHLGMLLPVLTNGELWEQGCTQDLAVEALRLAALSASPAFYRLRDRLIELGRHDALEIDPMDQQ